MQNVEWGEYEISQLFQLQKITQMLSKDILSDKGKFPVYSSESTNNGIVGYTDFPEFICDDKHPVFVTFGDHTRSFNIATNSFSVLDNVKVLLPIVYNVRCLLWIITVWRKQIPNIGYARHWKIAKNCVLKLPTKNGQIDFEFMENFIAELDAQRIAELDAYLSVSKLKDYTLTEEENKVLNDFSNGKIIFDEFAFKEIFNRIEQGKRLKKFDQAPGNIPFIMAGVTNTGVANYISNPIAMFPKNSITIDIFGNTFYRNFSFGAGDDTGVYWNDSIDYLREDMLYFAVAMKKALEGKFTYGKKLRSSQSFDFKMKLPVKNGELNFEVIRNFIAAIQKLVIKDLVFYNDLKMAAAKRAVNNKK